MLFQHHNIISDKVTVCLYESGLDKLIAFLVPLAVTLVACEASGGYENKLISRLLIAKIPVARANAERVRHFARSMGILAKTDAIDAQVIAKYGLLMSPWVNIDI